MENYVIYINEYVYHRKVVEVLWSLRSCTRETCGYGFMVFRALSVHLPHQQQVWSLPECPVHLPHCSDWHSRGVSVQLSLPLNEVQGPLTPLDTHPLSHSFSRIQSQQYFLFQPQINTSFSGDVPEVASKLGPVMSRQICWGHACQVKMFSGQTDQCRGELAFFLHSSSWLSPRPLVLVGMTSSNLQSVLGFPRWGFPTPPLCN